MHACPSCAAPLDGDGICTACGALSRGFFRGLDLGAPQIADAVARGLDFYRLLEVAPDAPLRTIAGRYRRLRALFPDEPSRLAPGPARRLALLEAAGRALTDPALRALYDQLRSGHAGEVQHEVLRCPSCHAPFDPQSQRCRFCGTPRPVEPPPAAPEDGPPPAEPVDYYALLGLTPVHLLGARQAMPSEAAGRSAPAGPPDRQDVDAAALAAEQRVLTAAGYAAAERDERLETIEVARRVLRDERRREQYDQLWVDFGKGRLDQGRLELLRHLQDAARAELREERGLEAAPDEGQALLEQGLGYLNAGLPREAVAALQRAVGALPGSAEAHAAYVRAILAADDPLQLGGHMLRQVLKSVEAAERLGAPLANGPAVAALCRGLLDRDAGERAAAEQELQAATRLDPQLAPAWRGLAALALARGDTEDALAACRAALAIDPRDEAALLLVAGACLRAGQRDQAHEAAWQVARLRGGDWTAEAVLQELGA